jgi:hypothetical protein
VTAHGDSDQDERSGRVLWWVLTEGDKEICKGGECSQRGFVPLLHPMIIKVVQSGFLCYLMTLI